MNLRKRQANGEYDWKNSVAQAKVKLIQ